MTPEAVTMTIGSTPNGITVDGSREVWTWVYVTKSGKTWRSRSVRFEFVDGRLTSVPSATSYAKGL